MGRYIVELDNLENWNGSFPELREVWEYKHLSQARRRFYAVAEELNRGDYATLAEEQEDGTFLEIERVEF